MVKKNSLEFFFSSHINDNDQPETRKQEQKKTFFNINNNNINYDVYDDEIQKKHTFFLSKINM